VEVRGCAHPGTTWTVIVILVVLWAILTVVGFVFEGLLWLGIIGIILIVGTLIFGVIRQRRSDRP
jgi:amino acid permease